MQVRSRRWLVDEVRPLGQMRQHGARPPGLRRRRRPGPDPRRLLGLRARPPDPRGRGLGRPRGQGLRPAAPVCAFLHTLRWNCVTATDPNLFQAPFRAGIKIDAYQMEPLRKALRLPRVNLFIADDTGLGKTIEAGLIARELLLRKKAKTIVVAAPPSVLEQWKAELEERFGLVFEILDRAYLTRMRRERGFGVNPWRTHSRFLVSHNLLIDPAYADPMREWLGPLLPGSLLILDEAHHAAPSSGGRYGIETKFTRAVRDLGGRFEHRLFLSATPHNGHSNSFSTLLELLDPYRFTRGVKVRGKKALEDVMVRRLKEDIREHPGRVSRSAIVERIVIDGLPEDAPELVLSRLLDEYRTAREERFASTTRRAQAAAGLLVVGLQQRLLSSIEAFARSLKVHRATVERQWEKGEQRHAEAATASDKDAELFTTAPDADDERGEWTPEELEAEEAAQIEAVTATAEAESPRDAHAEALWRREQALLDQMQEIAEKARYLPDAKIRRLIDWIRENLCPDLPPFGKQRDGPASQVEQPARPDLHREPRGHEALPEDDPRAGDRGHRPRRRAHRGDRRPHQRRPAQGNPAPVQHRPGEGPAAHPARHRRGPRGPELPGALRGPLPLRPALEPRPHRAAQRPHRPQAPAGPRGPLPLLRAPPAGRRPGARGARQQDRDDQEGARQPLEGHRRRHRAPAADRASATATPSGWRARSSRPTSTRRRSASPRKSSKPRASARKT